MPRHVLLFTLVISLGACGDDDATTRTLAPPPTPTSSTTAPPPDSTTSSPPTSAATTTVPDDGVLDISITVSGAATEVRVEGVPTSGRVEIDLGTEVRLVVGAELADEVHIHGYDRTGEVSPGNPAIIEFVADIPGIFEVELEGAHRELVELQVS